MGLKKRTLALSLLLLLGLTSCRTTLYPIGDADIFAIKKGTKVKDRTTTKDGYFLSDFYIENIAKAKVR